MIWTWKNESPSNSTYTNTFKSIFYQFFKVRPPNSLFLEFYAFFKKIKKSIFTKINWFSSHLRLEKLVYKLFCLVPGGRVKNYEKGGCQIFFGEFCALRKVRRVRRGRPASRPAGGLASQQKVPPSPGLIIISIIIIVMIVKLLIISNIKYHKLHPYLQHEWHQQQHRTDLS